MSNTQQYLTQQLTQLEALEQLLLEEKKVIQQQQHDELLAISEQKNLLLINIEQLDQRIIALPNFKEDKEAGEYQHELLNIDETLTRCKTLNTINGQIIEQLQLAVERLKSNLLETRCKSTMTYDSKGKTHGGLSSLGIKA